MSRELGTFIWRRGNLELHPDIGPMVRYGQFPPPGHDEFFRRSVVVEPPAHLGYPQYGAAWRAVVYVSADSSFVASLVPGLIEALQKRIPPYIPIPRDRYFLRGNTDPWAHGRGRVVGRARSLDECEVHIDESLRRDSYWSYDVVWYRADKKSFLTFPRTVQGAWRFVPDPDRLEKELASWRKIQEWGAAYTLRMLKESYGLDSIPWR